MIARLSGTVLEKHPMRVVVDVGGVGYDVHVPLSSFSAIGEAGAALTLRIHTHVREDALLLFGFVSTLEQTLFERLIGVSGIGPKLALSVLSGLAPGELVQAIAGSDVARLTSIPGIGRKTAERIVLELKDKVGPGTPAGAAAGPAGPREDLVSALINLGYHRPTAEKAVDRALAEAPGAGFEQALRGALKVLSR
jgi:holliday junction DNA helicase RuvA